MKVFGINIGAKESQSGSKNISSSTLSYDMLYQLSYMSVIAAAGVPRAYIFERSAQIPCSISEYFRKVQTICRRLKYDYAKACQIVGDSTKEERVKGLLLRFASSLISGEPESEFLSREAEAVAQSYDNEYGRKLETLKLWTDAYVSLNLSAVLIIIMGIVSTMIWKVEMIFIMGLMVAAIGSSVVGVWLIYLMSPREHIILNLAGSKEQKLAKKAFRILAPTALVICAFMLLRGTDNMGLLLMAGAIIVLPIGFISSTDDRKVNKRDMEVGVFLRSLGGICAAIGTTVKEALNQIDLKSLANLKTEVKRLKTRLVSGITAKYCWDRFVAETGSELVNRSVGMFYDAIDLGGEPGQAGYHAALFSTKIAMLRAKRKTVSSPFRWLCVAMHGAVVALLIFITESVSNFGQMVAGAQEAIPEVSGAGEMSALNTFNFAGLELMHTLIFPLIVIFSVSNALAATIADGGSRYKIFFNLAITAGISGAALTLLPTMADSLFKVVQV